MGQLNTKLLVIHMVEITKLDKLLFQNHVQQKQNVILKSISGWLMVSGV